MNNYEEKLYILLKSYVPIDIYKRFWRTFATRQATRTVKCQFMISVFKKAVRKLLFVIYFYFSNI